MDRVKLGRALGYGARHAAKAMAQAVDAATTPSAKPTAAKPGMSGESTQPVVQRAPARPSAAQVKIHARAAGKSAWAPVARFSSVIWLQVTGSFFALIALVLGQSLWVRRAILAQGVGSHEAQKLYGLVVVFLLFAYFAVSNFLRAARRERR
jgi:hypothetical protein